MSEPVTGSSGDSWTPGACQRAQRRGACPE
jgi:hypothetical protein